MSSNQISDFKPGDTVVYVARHKHNSGQQFFFEDCEPGQVSSLNDSFVFVKFWDGDTLKTTAQACSPSDLWHRK